MSLLFPLNSYCDKQRYPWNDYVSQALKASEAKSELITPPHF